jgi:endogenous inhibitor of DNA gyrase (YacG/DUF329 family)
MSANVFKSRRFDYIRSAMASISSIERPALRPCPICGKRPLPQYRPFCSARCAQIDLGRWLKGNYRIPTEEGPDEGGGDEAG